MPPGGCFAYNGRYLSSNKPCFKEGTLYVSKLKIPAMTGNDLHQHHTAKLTQCWMETEAYLLPLSAAGPGLSDLVNTSALSQCTWLDLQA